MKKIALVVDVENWAFYNIAKNITKYLKKYYEITIIPLDNFENNLVKLYLLAQEYDLIHFFWRGYINYPRDYSFTSYIEERGGNVELFKNTFIKNKIITTSVYDHLFLDENEMNITEYVVDNCTAYTVSSKILYNIYNKLPISKKPYATITDGVDLERFYPINLHRFENLDKRKIIIGWVGNSAWEATKREDPKGVNTLIKPAIEELQKEGFLIEPYFADRQVRMIPHDEMVNYYSKVDLYICASNIEGTPNPVLESMACGIPIISTNVGIVDEAFGIKQKEFILKERTKEELKEKIKYLVEHKEMFKVLSEENQEMIKSWSWENKANQFKKFFDYHLNKKHESK